MNTSLLSKFNSTLGLSTRVQDLYNTFILPSILLAGLVFNSLSIFIISNIKERKKNQNFKLYEYMFWNEIIDLAVCILGIFIPLIRGGVYFQFCYSLVSKIYEQYFFLYLGNTAILLSALMEISFTWNRLMSFNSENKQENTRFSLKLKFLVFLILALVVSLPNYVISRSIVPIGILVTQENLVLYSVLNNSIGNNIYGQIALFILTLFRSFFLYVFIFILNIIIAYKFKKQMSIKLKINIDRGHQNHHKTRKNSYQIRNKKKERKVTKMVLIISTFYLVAHFPHSFTAILFFIGINTTIYSYILLFTNSLLFTSHSSFLLVYLVYNSKFRKTFLQLIFSSSNFSNETQYESSSQMRSFTRKTN